MKVLFVKFFGIGNAVMAVPAVKALASLGHKVDVLTGHTSDDNGAREVFTTLMVNFPEYRFNMIDYCWHNLKHDIAILSIPYDGRLQNKLDFSADIILDGRTRPDPLTTGLVSWKQSELEYQMDNIVEHFGFSGLTPSTRIFKEEQIIAAPNSYYFGVGYKKDKDNFWSQKHWGTDNFIELAHLLLTRDENSVIYMTGDEVDLRVTIAPMIRAIGKPQRVIFKPTSSISAALRIVSECETYVGNDTGMMHVAAAADRNVVGLFFLENSMVKNPPACRNQIMFGYDKPTPEQVYEAIMKVKKR